MQKKVSVFPLGLAIFTMLFGAGNVVFPLAIGREVGDKVWFAIGGFFLSAVAVPLLGLIAAMLIDGDYKKFFDNMGRIPGLLVSLVCMMLIGPFGATPRCVALSYSAISWYLPGCSLIIYSVLTGIFIFVLTMQRSKVVELFGRILGPLKLTLLLSIIILGFLAPISFEPINIAPWQSFLKGLREGYFTLDLLATIFFANLIYCAIKARFFDDTSRDVSKRIALIGLKAGIIGGSLLGIVYLGFCVVSAMYGPHVYDIPKDQLLNALASLILGPRAGVLANITVAVACLTTAMALTTIFADYLSYEISQGKLKYLHSLAISVVIVVVMANLGFSGIMTVIEPIGIICYPSLIALSFANIAYKLFGFRWVKQTVYATFGVTVLVSLWPYIVRFIA